MVGEVKMYVSRIWLVEKEENGLLFIRDLDLPMDELWISKEFWESI